MKLKDGEMFFGSKDAAKDPQPSLLCCNNNDLLYVLLSPHIPPPLPSHKLNDGNTSGFGGSMEAHPRIAGDVEPKTVTVNLSSGFPNGGQDLLIRSKTATEKKTNSTLNYKRIIMLLLHMFTHIAVNRWFDDLVIVGYWLDTIRIL